VAHGRAHVTVEGPGLIWTSNVVTGTARP